MPVDFQSIQVQIREMGQQARLRERDLKERQELALGKLREYAVELDWLRERVDQASAANPSLRCAFPTDEPLTSQVTVPPLNCAHVLLAADGSQVIPNHHDAVEFGVINVGALRMVPNQSYAPVEIVESSLLVYDQLYTSEGYLITEEVVALMRDIAERRALAEYARRERVPVVTLTDGQLEVYGESKRSKEFEQKLDEYTRVLEEMARLNVITAGYVEKPASDLVVRMLELTLLGPGELALAGKKRSLRGLRDRKLFEQVLGPHQRSAVFGIQSKHRHFEGLLAVHFFYLNVSPSKHANIARVEIPGWVARDPALVDLLHMALVDQCRQMGARPYPYVLHRAHEVAVVSLEEKRQLENMIQLELRRQGLAGEEESNKQYAKGLEGRTRYS